MGCRLVDFTMTSTERGVLSVARFCYVFLCQLRGPAWVVGSYSISRGHFPKHYLQNLATDRTPCHRPTLYLTSFQGGELEDWGSNEQTGWQAEDEGTLELVREVRREHKQQRSSLS